MKNLILFLNMCIIAFSSCENISKNTENKNNNKDSITAVNKDTGKYKIENEKLLVLNDDIKTTFIISENGKNLAKVSGGPVYECYCSGDGTCKIEPHGRGSLHCC